MKKLKKTDYRILYLFWGLLYLATAILGAVLPAAEGWLRWFLMILSVAFFLPPWLVLIKATDEKNLHHRKVIRNLAAASLILTCLMLVLNLRSVGRSAAVGEFLHTVLSFVSAPMLCSQVFALSLFLWASLLIGASGTPPQK